MTPTIWGATALAWWETREAYLLGVIDRLRAELYLRPNPPPYQPSALTTDPVREDTP